MHASRGKRKGEKSEKGKTMYRERESGEARQKERPLKKNKKEAYNSARGDCRSVRRVKEKLERRTRAERRGERAACRVRY